MAISLNLTVTELSLKVRNQPSEHVAIMVGTLYVAIIEQHGEHEWHIRTLFDMKYNIETEKCNIHVSKQAAINEVYKMLKLV